MTRRGSAAVLLGLLVLCVIAFWQGLGSLGITDLDEGLYAAAAREMVLSGDFVTPRVNGVPFFEKPPLLYWLAALSVRLLGTREWAVRLPSACAATLTVLLVYWFGRRWLGSGAAWFGAAFLALAPVFVAAGRLVTTDALLVLFVTLAVVSLFEGASRRGRAMWCWAAVAGLSAGPGILAKGIIGLLLPILIVLVWQMLLQRQGCRMSRRRVLAQLALTVLIAVAVAAPWHIAAWRANGRAFGDEYIVRQHVQRFQGGDRSHRAPIWFFVPAFLVGFFPWSAFAVPAMLPKRRPISDGQAGDTEEREAMPEASVLLLLKTWFWVTFLLFSAAGSKLVSYILPLYPAAALLGGHWLKEAVADRRLRRSLMVASAAAGAIAVLLWLVILWPDPLVRLINHYSDRHVVLLPSQRSLLAHAVVPLGVISGSLVLTLVLAALGRTTASVAALVGGAAAFLLVAVDGGLPVVQHAAIGSLHTLTAEACHTVERDGQVVVAVSPPRRPSVLFYCTDEILRAHRVREIPASGVPALSVPSGSAIVTRSTAIGQRSDWALVRRHGEYSLWKVLASSSRSMD